MIHIPAIRQGNPYKSLEKTTLVHHVTGDPLAEVSQVTGSMIARDLSKLESARKELQAIPAAEMLAKVKLAGKLFATADLPLGDGIQSFEDYLRNLSGSTGAPIVFCRRNAGKVQYVLEHIDEILAGLTRGMDLRVLDQGHLVQDGRMMCFYPTTSSLGAILPSNSPGVHSLWVPSIALKMPLVLKPGREEPWTPYRVLQAFKAAGIPGGALNMYPTDHSGAGEILRGTGRSLLFGDSTTTDPYKNDHRVELHGPGYSKVILGEDAADNWPDYIDLIVESVCANGGRACVNASGVWTPRYGREIAEAMAEKMARVKPRAWDNPDAELSAFANPDIADRISGMIDGLLANPGAEDLVLKHRGTPRLYKEGRCAWLQPSVVLCDSHQHPLANKEFLFPYASVVEADQDEILELIGPTLVASVITEDVGFIEKLLSCRNIDRLNVGPLRTNILMWDQPHEGNLFTHLYKQRAFAQAPLKRHAGV